jgi:hypothetical protein
MSVSSGHIPRSLVTELPAETVVHRLLPFKIFMFLNSDFFLFFFSSSFNVDSHEQSDHEQRLAGHRRAVTAGCATHAALCAHEAERSRGRGLTEETELKTASSAFWTCAGVRRRSRKRQRLRRVTGRGSERK